MKRKISAIVFDMGGVLARPQDPACVRDMMGELGIDGQGGRAAGAASQVSVERFKEIYFAHRVAYDRGAIGAQEYWRAVAADLGVEPPEARLARIIERDCDAWFEYRPAMMRALPELRARVRSLGLLSNINVEGAERLRASFPRLELFDHLTLSCELDLMKPERAIFEHCLRGLGAKAGDSLFVDDNLENVEGARAAGMHSVRFIDEEHFFAELETFFELAK